MSSYCTDPVLVICEVQPREMGLPVHAYMAREEVREDGTERSKRVFANLPTEVRGGGGVRGGGWGVSEAAVGCCARPPPATHRSSPTLPPKTIPGGRHRG